MRECPGAEKTTKASRLISEIQKISLASRPKSLPRPTEGRFANVTNAGRDAVDAAAPNITVASLGNV